VRGSAEGGGGAWGWGPRGDGLRGGEGIAKGDRQGGEGTHTRIAEVQIQNIVGNADIQLHKTLQSAL